MADRPKHLFLLIEIPSMYVADIDELREFAAPEATESEHILNCIGEPSGVKLTTEISGDKDSTVVSVWGMVHSAELREASRGYGDGPHLTEDQIGEQWLDRLEGHTEDALSDAVDRLLAADINRDDIVEDLEWQLARVKRKAAS